MTDNELNKRIHEIMGLCWHDLKPQGLPNWYICKNCKSELQGDPSLFHVDFINTWTGFGILWEFMQKHEQFEEFITKYGSYATYPIKPPYVYCLLIALISPPALARAIVEFFEDR